MLRRSISLALAIVAVAFVSSPAYADDLFNPYELLKEGDWVVYKSEPAPGMVSETKQVVTKVEGKVITYEIHTKMVMNGKPLGEPTKTVQTIDLSKKAEGGGKEAPAPKTSKGEVEVKGKKLACVVIESETEVAGQKYVSKSWMSKDVPFGVVKVETNGKVAQQVADWGSK